jgi:protein TonB
MRASQKLPAALSAVLLAGGFLILSAPAWSGTPAHLDRAYNNPQPPYPDSAQQNGEQGTIAIDVLVRASGRPSRVRVVQSSGFPDLDDAALEGVLNWRFVPATRGGDAVKDWTTVKVVYQLPTLVAPPR